MALAEAPITDDLAVSLSRSFYSPSDVADLVGVSSSTILNYIHTGRLLAVQLSERTYRIPRKAVLRLLGAQIREVKVVEDFSREADL